MRRTAPSAASGMRTRPEWLRAMCCRARPPAPRTGRAARGSRSRSAPGRDGRVTAVPRTQEGCDMSDSISVLAVPEAAIAAQAVVDAPPGLFPERIDVPAGDLRAELTSFLERMDGAVRGLPGEVGGF